MVQLRWESDVADPPPEWLEEKCEDDPIFLAAIPPQYVIRFRRNGTLQCYDVRSLYQALETHNEEPISRIPFTQAQLNRISRRYRESTGKTIEESPNLRAETVRRPPEESREEQLAMAGVAPMALPLAEGFGPQQEVIPEFQPVDLRHPFQVFPERPVDPMFQERMQAVQVEDRLWDAYDEWREEDTPVTTENYQNAVADANAVVGEQRTADILQDLEEGYVQRYVERIAEGLVYDRASPAEVSAERREILARHGIGALRMFDTMLRREQRLVGRRYRPY